MSVKVDLSFDKPSRKSSSGSSGSSRDRKSASSNEGRDFDLMKYAKTFPHGGTSKWFGVKKCLEIPKLKSPIGITVLPHNKNIVIGVTGDDQVHIYDPNGMIFQAYLASFSGLIFYFILIAGNLVKILEPGRAFRRPSDMCALSDGRFAVRDGNFLKLLKAQTKREKSWIPFNFTSFCFIYFFLDFGIQLFDGNGNFLQSLCEKYLGRVYGLATDGEDNLITINTNVGNSKPDNPTRKGEQDVIIINIASDNITRRIELGMTIFHFFFPKLKVCLFRGCYPG